MLLDRINNWKSIGCSDVIIDWIERGVSIQFTDSPPPSFSFENHNLTFDQHLFVTNELERLLKCGYIKKLNYKPRFISPIGCVPKKNSGHRLIVDFRFLNSFCVSSSFKQEDIRNVAKVVEPKDNLSSIDIKDGFYHISINENSQEYLSFQFNGIYYSFTVCPFGLCSSPYFFSKILRPVVTYLRSLGIRLNLYVDDFLICASVSLATDHTDLVVNTLEDLGFKINFEKSCLKPNNHIDYLGFEIDTSKEWPIIKAKKERIVRIKRQIRSVLRKNKVKAKVLAKTAGLCISVAWAVTPGKLFLRHLYRLLGTKDSWNDELWLNDHCVAELNWWLKAVENWNFREIKPHSIDVQIVTDASKTGWGGTLGELEAKGDWDTFVSSQSSNYRELLAIFMCLYTFKSHIENKNVQVLTDNVTAMAYINHKGGPCPDLSELAVQIWTLVEESGLSLTCRHIAGVQNVVADRLSRLQDKANWRLSPGIFHLVDCVWGPHSIDRFATYQNTLLPRFNARFWDPLAENIDAMAQPWQGENNYVNPPWVLLPDIMDKIILEKAWVTLVAPVWPSQPWFQKLKTILVDTPIFLPRDRRTLCYMGPNPEPLRNFGWKVAIWRVYGGHI